MLYYTESVLDFIFVFHLFLTLQVFGHLKELWNRNSFILNNLTHLSFLLFPLDSAQKQYFLFLIFNHRKLEETSEHFVHSAWEFPQPTYVFFKYPSYPSCYWKAVLTNCAPLPSKCPYIFQLPITIFLFVFLRSLGPLSSLLKVLLASPHHLIPKSVSYALGFCYHIFPAINHWLPGFKTVTMLPGSVMLFGFDHS